MAFFAAPLDDEVGGEPSLYIDASPKKNVPQFIQNDHPLKLSVARDLKMMLGSPVVKKITNNESATAQISGFLSRSL